MSKHLENEDNIVTTQNATLPFNSAQEAKPEHLASDDNTLTKQSADQPLNPACETKHKHTENEDHMLKKQNGDQPLNPANEARHKHLKNEHHMLRKRNAAQPLNRGRKPRRKHLKNEDYILRKRNAAQPLNPAHEVKHEHFIPANNVQQKGKYESRSASASFPRNTFLWGIFSYIFSFFSPVKKNGASDIPSPGQPTESEGILKQHDLGKTDELTSNNAAAASGTVRDFSSDQMQTSVSGYSKGTEETAHRGSSQITSPFYNFIYVSGFQEKKHQRFDPYYFVKHIAQLPQVQQVSSPIIPPKTKETPEYTLVLTLEGTILYSSLIRLQDAAFSFPAVYLDNTYQVYVRLRPFLNEFLERMSAIYEIIAFTAAQEEYAGRLLDILDPKRNVFKKRLFRKHCYCVEGNFIKDLNVLGRDLSKTVVIDNSPAGFPYQPSNLFLIKEWIMDRNDNELLKLIPVLEQLVELKESVQPHISQIVGLHDLFCPNGSQLGKKAKKKNT